MNSENSKTPKPLVLILKLRFKNKWKDYCTIKS